MLSVKSRRIIFAGCRWSPIFRVCYSPRRAPPRRSRQPNGASNRLGNRRTSNKECRRKKSCCHEKTQKHAPGPSSFDIPCSVFICSFSARCQIIATRTKFHAFVEQRNPISAVVFPVFLRYLGVLCGVLTRSITPVYSTVESAIRSTAPHK
jgi:hypothetical protein